VAGRATLLGVLVVAALGASVVPPALAHEVSFATELQVAYLPGRNVLTGSIDTVPGCLRNRRIRVLLVHSSGERLLAATVRTDPDGRWRAEPTVEPAQGDRWRIVLVRSTRRSVGHVHRCLGLRAWLDPKVVPPPNRGAWHPAR
jgi:hypothetical protein